MAAIGGLLLIGGCSQGKSSEAAATDKADSDHSIVEPDRLGPGDKVVLDRHGTSSARAGSPTIGRGILIYLNCSGHGTGTVRVEPSSPEGYASSLTLPCGTVSDEAARMAGISDIADGPATISVTVAMHARWHLQVVQLADS